MPHATRLERLKLFLGTLFYFPLMLVRFGPVGSLQVLRLTLPWATFRFNPPGEVLYLVERHLETTDDGSVQMTLYAVRDRPGILAVINVKWNARASELVFWVSGGDPVPPALASEPLISSLGLDHAPRPVESSEMYINGLVIADSLRERIRSLLSVAKTYVAED